MTDESKAERQASRRAIKEGMIRQSTNNPLDKPASDLDVEVALELARQWDEEDVSFPSRPPRLDKQVSARLNDALLSELKEEARRRGVPLPELIREYIAEAVAKHKQDNAEDDARLKRILDHSSHSASGRDAFLFNERAHDAAYAVPLCPKCENEHEIGEPCF